MIFTPHQAQQNEARESGMDHLRTFLRDAAMIIAAATAAVVTFYFLIRSVS